MARVSFTPGSISGVVASAKQRQCGGHLAGPHLIEAGEVCIANALPPDNPEIGNSRWWHIWVCMDCCPIEFSR